MHGEVRSIAVTSDNQLLRFAGKHGEDSRRLRKWLRWGVPRTLSCCKGGRTGSSLEDLSVRRLISLASCVGQPRRRSHCVCGYASSRSNFLCNQSAVPHRRRLHVLRALIAPFLCHRMFTIRYTVSVHILFSMESSLSPWHAQTEGRFHA